LHNKNTKLRYCLHKTSAFYPFPTSPQYFSLICDPFDDPIISLHSRDISLFDCHMDRKWLYPFHWLKNRKCDFHWIFPSNSSEGGLVFIFKCGSRKEKYLGYFKGLLYIWEEMIMMALLYMAGLENSECIWKIQRKPEVVVSVSLTEK
jgi:hypothetical protein